MTVSLQTKDNKLGEAMSREEISQQMEKYKTERINSDKQAKFLKSSR